MGSAEKLAELGASICVDTARGHVYKKDKDGVFSRVLGSAVGRGHLAMTVKQKVFYMHRVVYEFANDPIPHGLQIDHINEVKTDNRLSNLRVVTQSENFQNISIPNQRSLTGLRGVSVDRRTGKFAAATRAGGKYRFIGRYKTIEEASNVYRYAVSILHTHNPLASSDVKISEKAMKRIHHIAEQIKGGA